MKRFSTTAIILRRVDYGEADRIITFMTPENGKIAVIARGVRKQKSKLAGGIELFSESQVTIIGGKGNLDILASARLVEHYRNIITDYDRVTAAYEVIKIINDITEDEAGSEFYDVLKGSLEALNNLKLPTGFVVSWYKLNILRLLGSEPDLAKDSSGMKLVEGKNYIFNLNEGSFVYDADGTTNSNHIKSMRLLMTQSPEVIVKVSGALEAAEESSDLIDKIFRNTPGIP